jgi:precorrin-6B methylase 2
MNNDKKFRGLRNIVWKLLRTLKLAAFFQLSLASTLVDDGWFNSYYKKESIDKQNNPIPWNTYPFLKFIGPRLKNSFTVFEYGCGNSTIWYSQRVRSITAVENDKDWFERIRTRLPANARLIYKELKYNDDYSREVLNQAENFHMIIIDGRDRVNSVKNSIKKLTKDGVIIFDNSELVQYKEAVEYLEENNFKHIDFWGMSPITAHYTSTSIFYRPDNCLTI